MQRILVSMASHAVCSEARNTDDVPDVIRNGLCLCIVIVHLSRIFSDAVRGAIRFVVDERTLLNRTLPNDGDAVDEAEQHRRLTPDDEASEVNSFFGWAIRDLRRKLSGQRFELKHGDDDVDVDDLNKIVELLDSMRMFHDAAVMDDEYMD